MTYPVRLFLLDPERRWPGDPINPDGTVRTPLWDASSPISPDQYELIEERSDPVKRAKWGTLFFLRAREKSEFYYRMAAWPLAFEEAMQAACARHFPGGEFSIYAHGHSTGGPFVQMLLQRVENAAGLVGGENSPFGFIQSAMFEMGWQYPFNFLVLRTWRHLAKYAGPESGPDGCWRLPWIMEDVFDAWDRVKHQPQFKAEYHVTYGALDQLAEAARVTAARQGLDTADTEALVRRYLAMSRPLEGPGVKPLPPLLDIVAQGTRDQTIERQRSVALPMLAQVNPPPKARAVLLRAGVHAYERPEPDLPRGLLPMMLQLWDDAITGGFYLM
jgi:hypothetical protein